MDTFKNKSIYVFLSLTLALAACAGSAKLTKESPSAGRDGSTRILDVSAAGGEQEVDLTIKATGPIQYTVFKISDPMRLIVDMSGADLSGHEDVIEVGKGPVASVNPIYFVRSNDSRLEVNLNDDVDYRINNDNPAELKISIASKGSGYFGAEGEASAEEPTNAPANEVARADVSVQEKAPEEASSEKTAEPEPLDTASVNELVSGEFARVENVEFRQMDSGLARVEVTMSQPAKYRLIARNNLNRLVLDLENTVVSKDSEQIINVSVDSSKVKTVALFQFAGGEKPITKVVVNLDKMALYNISSEGRKIYLDIGEEAVLALASRMSEGSEGSLVKPKGAPLVEEKVSHEKRISLDFQKADIHNILRIIADVSGRNIITSDQVKGSVTIKLKNVPWDVALDVILKNNGLDKIVSGGIIRVSTADQVQKEKEAVESLQATEEKIAPLYTRIFEVNYADVSKLKDNLESMKSERGTVEINARTNTLIIKDNKDKLAEMKHLIDVLDKKEQQVLIEARIVEVTHSYARQIGIQWGGYYNNVTGQNFPATVGVTGGAAPSPNAAGGGSVVSLPISNAAAGAIGLTLGHINGAALLDARLMAMENAGEGRIVSMPKITTMNNMEAMIESGQEVPYQTVSADGTKVEFKKATLSLKVTPHVTTDRNIRLQIETSKDEPNFDQAIQGVPPIFTKKAKTEVLVADGDTTVIGGLFKDNTTNSDRKVPLFGDIPVLGWLFKSESIDRKGEELLIFITPKIVE